MYHLIVGLIIAIISIAPCYSQLAQSKSFLEDDGLISVTLKRPSSVNTYTCINATRGWTYDSTDAPEWSFCSNSTNIDSVYVTTCQFPVSPFEPHIKFIFVTKSISDRNFEFEADYWSNQILQVPLIGRPQRIYTIIRTIPLCCGGSFQGGIDLQTNFVGDWGDAFITGDFTANFTIIMFSGSINDLKTVLSRDCLMGNNDTAKLYGNKQGTNSLQITLTPDWVRKFGPGRWYFTVISTGNPVSFGYQISYFGSPWKSCPQNCSSQGVCNHNNGTCSCNACFNDPSCSVLETCNYSGICQSENNTCSCLRGFYGSNCEFKEENQDNKNPNNQVEVVYFSHLNEVGFSFLVLGMLLAGALLGFFAAYFSKRMTNYKSIPFIPLRNFKSERN